MIIVLLILLLTALLAWAVGLLKRYSRWASVVALLGVASGLTVDLILEGLQGGGIAGTAIDWPLEVSWLDAPVYRSDLLSAGLGAWCLLLGGVCLLGMSLANAVSTPQRPIEMRFSTQAVVATSLVVTVLYSLVHTWELRVFVAQMLVLILLLWLANTSPAETNRGEDESAQLSDAEAGHHLVALGLGVVCLLVAVLVIGRTTGGDYDLSGISLSALGQWPLSLIAIGSVLWLGLAPVLGWSARGHNRTAGVLAQALVLGVPILTLLLRLQALVTAQGLAGTLPEGWGTFTTLLAWAGAVTALAAGAATIITAGGPRCLPLFTTCVIGLAVWGLGLDSPTGRLAAVTIVLTLGAGRVLWFLVQASGLVPQSSLAWVAPLPGGFVGVWLLGSGVGETNHASLVILLAGAVIFVACGAAFHLGATFQAADSAPNPARYLVGAISVLLAFAGLAPVLWLPQAAVVSSVAGGKAGIEMTWAGLTNPQGLTAPVLLLGLSALLLVAIGWLLRTWMKSSANTVGLLLPTALGRRSSGASTPRGARSLASGSQALIIWGLSLAWLEEGLWGSGALLMRLGRRMGTGLGRLEGRYYLPIAVVLALIALLVVTR